MMAPQEIIRRKRDGLPLSRDDIAAFIDGMMRGEVGDEQAAAFAMAVFFRGMSTDECADLTSAMTHSGVVLDWSLPGPVIDKHSTGGIGDTVSLVLAPLVAACGGFVPMIAGRGLGHTGGTLDKLDAIPGYQTQPSLEVMRAAVRQAGCAIVGQTADLAPADRRLYAIRDVTATVESIPLITASILAKKRAAGLQALVMDVKSGNGAFMPTPDDARALAQSLVSVAGRGGLPMTALITDMNEPLASAAGNALETRLAIDMLRGLPGETRLREATLALGAEMLVLGGLAANTETARVALERALASGAAAERFARMVALLGGPADLLEHIDAPMPPAPVIVAAHAARTGFVSAIDTRRLGLAVVALGGGRLRAQATIDHAVGLSQLAPRGARTEPRGAPLALVHARTREAAEHAAAEVREAYAIATEPAPRGALIIERIGR